MLSWDDFRYVKAIADTRSLAGAAEQLGINHSTVFRRLGLIEQQLGLRLFERGRGGYALTPCGEEMVDLAHRLGEDIVTFERRVTGQDLRPSGELRITTSDVVLLRLLNDVLIGFRRAYPDILLDIVVTNRTLNLSKRDADVALRATYQAPDSLAGSRVARLAWAVYGPHALVSNSFDPLTDCRRHNWIAFADHFAIAKALKWLKDHVDEERIVYKVNTLVGLAEASAGGVGNRAAALLCRSRGTRPLPAHPHDPRTRGRAVAADAPGPERDRPGQGLHGLLHSGNWQAPRRAGMRCLIDALNWPGPSRVRRATAAGTTGAGRGWRRRCFGG